MSNFIVSLDFELMWGLRDHHTISSYGKNIIGARDAIPQILALFEKEDVQATWATVGLLFCETKDEIIDIRNNITQPGYKNKSLSNYEYVDEIGKNEKEDKYFFGKSIVDQIKNTAGQEIGTHTFSHFYCLEDGADLDAFENDIDVAFKVAKQEGIQIKSIVFPRNQYNGQYLKSCASRGILSYRGNQSGYAYKSHSGAENTKLKRGLRLLDAYTGFLNKKDHSDDQMDTKIKNIPASRFLRPNAGKLSGIHPIHVSTIIREMKYAAKNNTDYHLWWHPHNFGAGTDANMNALKIIVAELNRLRGEYNFQSRAMENAA